MDIDRERQILEQRSQALPTRVLSNDTEIFGGLTEVLLKNDEEIFAYGETFHHDVFENSERVLMPGVIRTRRGLITQTPFGVISGIGNIQESASASDTVSNAIRDYYLYSIGSGNENRVTIMANAINTAGNFLRTEINGSLPNTGASVAMVDFNTGEPGIALFGSIGDARVYKYSRRKDRVRAITADDKLLSIDDFPVIPSYELSRLLTKHLTEFTNGDNAEKHGFDSIDNLLNSLQGDYNYTPAQAANVVMQWLNPETPLFRYVGSQGASILPRKVSYQSGDIFFITSKGISDLVSTDVMLEQIHACQYQKKLSVKVLGKGIRDKAINSKKDFNWSHNASQGLIVIQAPSI